MPLDHHHRSPNRIIIGQAVASYFSFEGCGRQCMLVKWREMVSEAQPRPCLCQALAGDLSALYLISRVLMDKTIII